MINGVIPLGYIPGPLGRVEFIATDDGARILPEPSYVGPADGNGYRAMHFALTRENIIALRFCGLTAVDANHLLKSIEAGGVVSSAPMT